MKYTLSLSFLLILPLTLLLRRVGDEDAAGSLRLRVDTADQDAVLHGRSLTERLLGPEFIKNGWHSNIVSASRYSPLYGSMGSKYN